MSLFMREKTSKVKNNTFPLLISVRFFFFVRGCHVFIYDVILGLFFLSFSHFFFPFLQVLELCGRTEYANSLDIPRLVDK